MAGMRKPASNQRFQRTVLALRARPAAEPRRWAACGKPKMGVCSTPTLGRPHHESEK
jgi:hypothetical protein